MSAKHLRLIRSLPCSVPGCYQSPIHAHHVRTAANSGTGLKPDDRMAVPLCFEHHAEIHHIGKRTFEHKYGVDLRQVASFISASQSAKEIEEFL